MRRMSWPGVRLPGIWLERTGKITLATGEVGKKTERSTEMNELSHMPAAGGSVRRLMAVLLALVLCLAGIGVSANANVARADETNVVSGNGSITIEDCEYNGIANQGAEVRLYQVAVVGDAGSWQPASAFANLPVDWTLLTSGTAEDANKLSETLKGLIEQHGIAPTQSGLVGADGSLKFTGLADGLYLILYGANAVGGMNCDSGKSLVALPASSDEMEAGAADRQAARRAVERSDGQTVSQAVEQTTGRSVRMSSVAADDGDRDVVIQPKLKCTVFENPRQPIDLTVTKVWKGDHEHPAKVIAQLLRDGEVVDEAELNEANGWKHTWKDLEPDYDWTVVEKTVPDGYVVTIERDGDVVTLTNTYTPPATPPETPPEEVPPATPPSKVPPLSETGVAVLAIAGVAVLLLAVGLGIRFVRRRKRG